MARAGSVIETSINYSTKEVIFVCDGEEMRVGYDNMAPETQMRAAYHGIKQVVQDAAAKPRDPKTGRSATPAEKREAMQAVVDRFNNGGAWSSRAEPGESEPTGLLRRALMQLTGKTQEEVDKFLEPLTKAEQKALERDEKIAPAIADIKRADADRRGKTYDTKAMLANLWPTKENEQS